MTGPPKFVSHLKSKLDIGDTNIRFDNTGDVGVPGNIALGAGHVTPA